MGLDINCVRLLLYARQLGANYSRVVTVGRQELFAPYTQVCDELDKFKIPYPAAFRENRSRYCEELLSLLGAQDVQSIDNSGYESATIIHDMNRNLPDRYKGRFTTVFDAGTLEHIFNYPTAIRNCMDLLGEGGFFIGASPTNNFMGHGFYQFGPDLFSSVFSPPNGFELIKLIVCEAVDGSQWYEVVRPDGAVDSRVRLINRHPTLLMCIARRTDATIEPFSAPPQQQVAAWSNFDRAIARGEANIGKTRGLGAVRIIKTALKAAPGASTVIRNVRYFSKPTFPRRYYKPIDL